MRNLSSYILFFFLQTEILRRNISYIDPRTFSDTLFSDYGIRKLKIDIFFFQKSERR